jgi:predicted lipid-binding transport protein (Tim44 family)
MGGIAGFALGGLLGSLLFGGMGRGFGGGIGLLEILLIVVGVFLLLRVFRGRQATSAYAGAGGASAYGAAAGSQGWLGGATAATTPVAPADLERGIGNIRQMDPGFDPAAFTQWAQRAFVDVQEGIGRRDVSLLNERLTPQEYARLQGQCDQLRGARQTNRVEQIQFKRVEMTEAWQERGQDWATVYVAASLVDYTLDDTTGNLVDGSRTPQDVEEYWTFTRPVGPQPWRLSAIQTS